MGFFFGHSKCPICDARLKPWQFKLVHLWTWKQTFRCHACATMLAWTGRTRARPMIAIWVLFFSPPALAQAYYGSWLSPDYPHVFLFLSWLIGSILLLATALFCPWGAVKCRDE